MYASLLTLAPMALAVSVNAFQVPSHVISSGLFHGLHSRQLSGADEIPAECQPTCNGPLSSLQNPRCGNDAACVCTIQVLGGYRECSNCLLGMIEPGPDRNDLADVSQQNLDQLVDSCAAEGYEVNAGAVDGSYAAGSSGGSTSDPPRGGLGGNSAGVDDDDDDEDDSDGVSAVDDEGAAVGLRSSVLGVAGAVGVLLVSL